jgi:hypothetical protein
MGKTTTFNDSEESEEFVPQLVPVPVPAHGPARISVLEVFTVDSTADDDNPLVPARPGRASVSTVSVEIVVISELSHMNKTVLNRIQLGVDVTLGPIIVDVVDSPMPTAPVRAFTGTASTSLAGMALLSRALIPEEECVSIYADRWRRTCFIAAMFSDGDIAIVTSPRVSSSTSASCLEEIPLRRILRMRSFS